jgi:quercetin dioxygenase-like cupin family protein
MSPRRRIAVAGLATIVGALAVIGVAFGTPPTGIKSAEVKARGDFPDRTDAKFKFRPPDGSGLQVANVRRAGEVAVQQIVIEEGGHTGWHSHPGPVIVVVKSGALTYIPDDDTSCKGRTYKAGEAFVDPGQGHVHIARNLSGEDVELWATYFGLPPGSTPRIDADDPGNCPA